jgi:hypothetical protein
MAAVAQCRGHASRIVRPAPRYNRNGAPELKSAPGSRAGRHGQRAAAGGDNGQGGDAPKVANRPI